MRSTRPSEGRIAVGGQEITARQRRALPLPPEDVTFIFQTFNLFPALTALENVAFGVEAAGTTGARPSPPRCSRASVSATGSQHFPHELSGGEQQRVAIARALATGNPVLFADEPTGELDFRTGIQILQLLREQADAGRPSLVVTHNREISRMADRVVELPAAGSSPTARRPAAPPSDFVRAALVRGMRALWLRWTWRDFRARWGQVLTTSLILAGGVGAFAGLGGLQQWRERSADLSLQASRSHDIRVDLPEGSFVPAGRLRAAADRLPRGQLEAYEERLVAASQIDASRPGRPVLLPARLIGIPGSDAAAARVDALHVKAAGGLTPATPAGTVLDWNFAHHFGLPARGWVRIAGLGRVRYLGLGVTPQYLLIVDEAGMSGAEAGLAVVYLPLAAAQHAAGRPRQVNELVARVAAARSPVAVARSLQTAVGHGLPGVGAQVTLGVNEPVRRILYQDARNDEKTYLAFAVLILFGAALAAFNLVSRVVEAQRREIGIGMALGVPPRVLARRPLLLGLQIGVLGAILGVPAAIALSDLIKGLLRDFLPLPVYASTFPLGFYLVGGALALLIPILAAVLPVRRAIRVQPVEAIRSGHHVARAPRLGAAMRRISLPGGAVSQLPLRNLVRSSRRTAMTIVGLGAVLTAVVAVGSMIDSLGYLADRQQAALLNSSPRRLQVALAGLTPRDSPTVRAIAAAPGVARAEPGLTVAASASSNGRSVRLALSFVDRRSAIWRPQLAAGRNGGGGVILASKAAADLGVRIGESVVIVHPRLVGGRLELASTRVPLTGIHTNPVRAYAYMDTAQAAQLGLRGVADSVTVVPRGNVAAGTLERGLFGRPGVASVQPVAAEATALRTTVDQFGSSIQIVEFITLALALLVALTSTSVSVDEGRREYATMFAFGLPPRTGLRVIMTESLTVGVLGTALGVGLGVAVSTWIVNVLMADTFPELSTQMALGRGSVATAFVVGIAAVTAAPLLSFRRVSRMDLPSTLRVME